MSHKQKIGLFFGSFNPPHNGHIAVAVTAVEEAGLDCLWFIVSPQNPHKDPSILCEEHFRLNMVEQAIWDLDMDDEKFIASEIEFNMPRPSYTIDTVDAIKKLIPDSELYLIFGLDTAKKIPHWKEGERLLSENNLLIHERPGFSDEVPSFLRAKNHRLLSTDIRSETSSTAIRKRIREGRAISFLVSPSVAKYIHENDLFIGDENGANREIQTNQGRPGLAKD
jgi:nicotinate-nucleotide adenylyltransferase